MKKNNYFFLVYLCMVVVLLLLVELVLRMCHYGIDTRLFIHPKQSSKISVLNHEFIKKYYPGMERLYAAGDKLYFTTKKLKNEYRCFVVGGSTAQGFPYNSNQTFDRMTGVLVNKYKNSDKTFNFYNLGFSAMSSYYVKDVSEKIIQYQPDLLILYTGHNEIYGTLGYNSGKSRLSKLLYLKLYDIKLFQLIDNVLIKPITAVGGKKESGNSATMMANLFNNRTVPNTAAVNRAIEDDFIKNIDSVVRLYQKKNIPVIIIDPVSNLINMPPFKSEGELPQNIIDAVTALQQHSEKNTPADIEKMEETLSGNQTPEALYAKNYLAYAEGGNFSIDELKQAKDNDLIPFRARSGINIALKNYAGKNPYPHFIETEKVFEQLYGTDILSNKIFIDHLHFNKRGNFLLSVVLAYQVAKIFPEIELPEYQKIIGDEQFVYDESGITVINDYMASKRIISIVQGSPYKEMPIRFLPYMACDQIPDELHTIFEQNGTEPDLYKAVIEHYRQNNDYKTSFVYTKSYRIMNPSYYGAYYNHAVDAIKLGSRYDYVKYHLFLAYILSGYDQEIYKFIEDYADTYHHPEIFLEIKKH